jgi:alpha-tubulin suppressor-like RCC1 family protein
MGALRRAATTLEVAALLMTAVLIASPANAVTSGEAWAVGNNNYGQLGDGTTTTRSIPGKVLGFSGVKAIAAGAQHSLAVRSDGTVRGWGNNGHGQLGNGKINVVQVTAVKALRLGGVKTVAGGWFHSLART